MNKEKKIKISWHQTRQILVTIYCILITACTAYVLLNFYSPNQNALGALCSVCMDVLCIIILIILAASLALNNYGLSHATKIFACLIVITIGAIFLDFLNWAFDGSLEFGHLTFWFTTGSLCTASALAGIFIIYIGFYMVETHGLTKIKKRAKICAILNLFSMLMTFIFALTGLAFVFVDGHYETGPLYDVCTVIPIASLLYITIFLFVNVKEVGIHDAFSVSGYIVFMVAGALVESAYRIGTTYVSVAIADIFIFVMLQNEVLAKEKHNAQMWKKKSNTDELTGLLNRHAYEADINKLDANKLKADKLSANKSGLDFVFVSVDVNSLKEVNDTYGHNAGDELLIGAAECLTKCFGNYGKLYRMGGDEFIALIKVNNKRLTELKQEIIQLTNNWRGELVDKLSISCGYVALSETEDMSIKQIAVLADQRMYEAKNEYYRANGIERRKVLY